MEPIGAGWEDGCVLITVDDPARPDVSALLAEHLADMFATYRGVSKNACSWPLCIPTPTI